MKLLLAMILVLPSIDAECAASLKLRGVGQTAARQVRPYADCLNSRLGTLEQLRAACSTPRAQAVAYRGSRTGNSKVVRAVRWLDAMARERTLCETHLEVIG